MSGTKFLTVSQVAERYGVCNASIRNWVASGKFLKPVQITEATYRWRLADIEQWEDEKAAQSKVDAVGQHA